ncbi:MAG: hypothetical protein GX653_09865 [Clostridiales bacterium]|nr:hypothetical protein [Clostridiales bacterium]
MKTRVLILMLALSLALPVLSLAAEATQPATAPAATEQAEQTADTTAPFGMGRNRRWNAAPTAPGTNYADENNDGVCDNCGQPGQAPGRGQGPNFTDENNDGVCDHFADGNMAMMRRKMQRSAMAGMRGRKSFGPGMQGRPGMGARPGMGQAPNAQGPNYADENNDGVCDNLPSTQPAQRGPGRNRR